MNNLEKYQLAFINGLGAQVSELNEDYTYENQENWDSVAHMMLIAEIEDQFAIEMEMEDIIDFSSFEKGKEILEKYNISF